MTDDGKLIVLALIAPVFAGVYLVATSFKTANVGEPRVAIRWGRVVFGVALIAIGGLGLLILWGLIGWASALHSYG